MTTEVVYEHQKRVTKEIYHTAAGTQYIGGVESITRAGSVATLTKKNHGFVNGDVVTVSGADQAAYNGAVTVGGATQDTFTYTVAGTPANATGNLLLTSAEQSQWANCPEALHIVALAAATTIKVEVCIALALGWAQLGADLTVADVGKIVPIPNRYNFVRARRSAGTGAVRIVAQL